MTLTRRQFLTTVAAAATGVASVRTFPTPRPLAFHPDAVTMAMRPIEERRARLLEYGVSVDGGSVQPMMFEVSERADLAGAPARIIGQHIIGGRAGDYMVAQFTMEDGIHVDPSRLRFVLRDSDGDTVIHGARYSFQLLV